MEEARETAKCAVNAACDVLRYMGDVSYAILPPDVAHGLGDLKKAIWTNVRSAIDWEIGWIDERVTGGDRLREEWQRSCSQEAPAATDPVN
jgi:hypothetical protein